VPARLSESSPLPAAGATSARRPRRRSRCAGDQHGSTGACRLEDVVPAGGDEAPPTNATARAVALRERSHDVEQDTEGAGSGSSTSGAIASAL